MTAPALVLILAAAPKPAPDPSPLFGFTPEGSTRERAVEALFLSMPLPARCREHHRELTKTPHTAGTDGARRVAEYVAGRFREYGLETEVAAYDVLLSSPTVVDIQLVAPAPALLANREEPVLEDPDSGQAALSPPWHAYTMSGDVTADVVYVNHGRAEDYDALAKMGIDVRGKIALARHFKGYRASTTSSSPETPSRRAGPRCPARRASLKASRGSSRR